MFIEVNRRYDRYDKDFKVHSSYYGLTAININKIIYFRPVKDHCYILMQKGDSHLDFYVKESYEQVKKLMTGK